VPDVSPPVVADGATALGVLRPAGTAMAARAGQPRIYRGDMSMTHTTKRTRLAAALAAAVAVLWSVAPAAAQAPEGAEPGSGRARLDAPAGATEPDAAFEHMRQRYVASYRLGAGDAIAVRVAGEPDYTVDHVVVSPFGAVYHPLLGDVEVAGLTVDQATERLRDELAEYIIRPRVTVSLVEAHSAKVGVLGDVVQPGIVPMVGPMTVLDAITASGGITNFGAATDVTLLRQMREGQTTTVTVNVKRILEGKADPHENLALQPGDTIVVHGNKKKSLAWITSLTGFSSFLSFVRR
jgi:polysaccharide export outer membrane protein